MKVLGIGYGRQLFKSDNPEVARLELCAAAAGSYDQIVFTALRENYKKTIHKDGLTIYPTSSKHTWQMLFDAYRVGKSIIEKGGIDVVTAQDPFETGIVAYLLARKYKLPLNIQEHTDVFSSTYWRAEKITNYIRYYIGWYIIKKADTVRVVSERSKKAIENMFGIHSKIRCLPVAISLDSFKFRERVPKNTFTYISVARFVKQKNLILLIKAFAAAYQQNSNLRLLLVGTGNELTSIKKEINKNFKNDSPITILEWSNDVATLFSEADAYVLSSNYEGWGRVLVEAQVSGLPVVTTDVGCAGEVIKNNEHGLIVPVNDERALSKALVTLSEDKSLYKKIIDTLRVKNQIPGTNMESYGNDWMQTLR